MEFEEKLEEKFNQCHKLLQDNAIDSFEYINKNPQEKEKILNLWKTNIKKVTKEIMSLSEKYGDRDIIKSISKMLIFGR